MENDIYNKLCKILGLVSSSANPFSTKEFFEEFNRKIPPNAHINQQAKPQDIIGYRQDVEDVERKYFCGWLDNTIRGNNATPENLDKTFKLLGRSAHAICQAKNISSRWTDNEADATAYTLPS